MVKEEINIDISIYLPIYNYMKWEIIPFPLSENSDNLWGFIFSRCEWMKRRINFLLKWADGTRLLRRRTIKRCIGAIEKRWIQLSDRIWELRENPALLRIAISIYVELTIRRWYFISKDKDSVIQRIIASWRSATEIEMILELLRLLKLSPSHVMAVLWWVNQWNIIQTDDQRLYELIRKSTKPHLHKKDS